MNSEELMHAPEVPHLPHIAIEDQSPSEKGPSSTLDEPFLIECEGLTIDLGAHAVSVDGCEVTLTRSEYNVLVELARHPNIPLAREAIFSAIWDADSSADFRTIDSHIKNLRAKLNDDAISPRFIKSAHGFGYQFVGKITRSTCAMRDASTYEVETWRSATDGRTLTISRSARLVAVNGATVELTPTEYETLLALSNRKGDAWTNEDLSMEVLGVGFEASGRNLASHIKNLRAKLGDNARKPSWIKTVHGVGYRMIGTLAETETAASPAVQESKTENAVLPSVLEQEIADAVDLSMQKPKTSSDIDPSTQEPETDKISISSKTLPPVDTTASSSNTSAPEYNLEFPDFPEELLAVEPDIHTRASRYAVALYTIARVAPENHGLNLVQLRRTVRPYMLATGLKRLSVPTLSAACIELAARGLGHIELDENGGVSEFFAIRLSAEEALRIAMEFDTLGAYDPSLHNNESDPKLGTPAQRQIELPVEPQPNSDNAEESGLGLEAKPAPALQSEPEPTSTSESPSAGPQPEAINPKPSAESIAQIQAQIVWATEKLASLDPAPLQAALEKLTQERARLGLFKFSAKKELDKQIAHIEQELDALSNSKADRDHFQTLLDSCTHQLDSMLKAQ